MNNGDSQQHARRTGESTLQPGDVIIVANDTVQPADMRAGLKGWGRLLHCDDQLHIKGELFTGKFDLLLGLSMDDQQRLIVTCPSTADISVFDMNMQAVTTRLPPRRRYGNIISDRNGGFLLGIHSSYGEPLPRDEFGDGKLVQFKPHDGQTTVFDVDVDGGRGNKHFVSNLAIAPDRKTVFYTSEAGRRLLRYDIENQTQLDDFATFEPEEGGTYGVDVDDQGHILIARGSFAEIYDPSGKLLQRLEGDGRSGWTRATFCHDQKFYFFSNFLEGVFQRRSVETGEVVSELVTGMRGSLTASVEYFPA